MSEWIEVHIYANNAETGELEHVAGHGCSDWFTVVRALEEDALKSDSSFCKVVIQEAEGDRKLLYELHNEAEVVACIAEIKAKYPQLFDESLIRYSLLDLEIVPPKKE